MVVRDLSFPDKDTSSTAPRFATPSLQLASVTDRFIAFILDFLILSPIVSFSVAGVLRNLKTVLILNSDSDQAVVIWVLFVIGMVVVSCVLQALFFYFWQATPGQKFMQLQVISYPQHHQDDQKQLTFAQSLLRPMGWWLGTGMLGVPFMEILGHPLRRAFHERVSDTLVISLKQEPVDAPLAVESRYIRSTMWIFFGFMFLMGVTFMGKTYKTAVVEGLASGQKISKSYCPDIPTEKYKDEKRLDVALALFFAEQSDESCVYTEAQNAVWNLEGEEKALGLLAMSVISEDKKEVDEYQSKICTESEKSEACAILKFMQAKDEDRGNILRRAGLGLVSSRLLLLKSSLELGHYVSAAGLIRDLEVEKPLQTFLDKSMVKTAWALNVKIANEKKSRTPASSDEKEILQEFKKRYGIE
ncbi:RDD family protein [Bdellovibrio sp. HCB337]|uniref:RDD family protein n=1 Tax=Bdellovibrio sp. HCB337 TaxID=3394358 RepID=UPI0039A5A518